MDITRTIPQTERPDWIAQLFDGHWVGDVEFPFGRAVKNIYAGNWLYLIYRRRVHGRLKISRVEHNECVVPVGSQSESVYARTVVFVNCPGELAPGVLLTVGHRGHRYDNMREWQNIISPLVQS